MWAEIAIILNLFNFCTTLLDSRITSHVTPTHLPRNRSGGLLVLLYFMCLCICIYVFLFVLMCIKYYLMPTGSANSSTCQSSRSGGNHSVITAVTPGLCTPALEGGGVVLSTLYWGDNAKNIMWRDRQRHGDGVRREENIIWWSCQYFHHIVVLPIWALNLIIERGEIMEMIKRGERIFSPLDLAMKHNGWLLWLYFWFNLDFS